MTKKRMKKQQQTKTDAVKKETIPVYELIKHAI